MGMISVRWPIRFFNRLREKQRRIKRVDQSPRTMDVGSQIAGDDLIGGDFAILQKGSFRAQGYPYQAIDMSERGSLFEVNERRVRNVGDCQSGILGQRLGGTHRSHLPFVNETKPAYGLSGQKWSRG